MAGPAILKAGGRFLARGTAIAAFESGLLERIVIIEFESAAAAIAAYESSEYQQALAALDPSSVRDIRIVEAAHD